MTLRPLLIGLLDRVLGRLPSGPRDLLVAVAFWAMLAVPFVGLLWLAGRVDRGLGLG